MEITKLKSKLKLLKLENDDSYELCQLVSRTNLLIIINKSIEINITNDTDNELSFVMDNIEGCINLKNIKINGKQIFDINGSQFVINSVKNFYLSDNGTPFHQYQSLPENEEINESVVALYKKSAVYVRTKNASMLLNLNVLDISFKI